MKPTYLILASLSLTNAAPPDDDIHRLGKALARFQGCFLQRAWQDLQHIQSQKGNVVDCLCRSQDQLSSLIRRDFDICIDPSLPFSGVLKQAGAGKQPQAHYCNTVDFSPITFIPQILAGSGYRPYAAHMKVAIPLLMTAVTPLTVD